MTSKIRAKTGVRTAAEERGIPKDPRHWLVKQEPEGYSWKTFASEGRTSWDGVRNYQARNNLRAMHAGDPVLFYESGDSKAVVGVARVARRPIPTPRPRNPAGCPWNSRRRKPLRSP